MDQAGMKVQQSTDPELPRIVDPNAVWNGKCGKCGAENNRYRACWRCGLHAFPKVMSKTALVAK